MDLVAEEKVFKEKTVNDLMEYPYAPASRSAYHPITSGYSAMAVVEPLAREKGLHRVAIVSPDRKMSEMETARSSSSQAELGRGPQLIRVARLFALVCFCSASTW